MNLTLIVCTLGRTEQLTRLLASLAGSRTAPAEILVVDQNPDGYLEPTLGRFTKLPIRRIACKPGLSRARNAGLAASGTDVVGFPDDDCWYPGDVVERVEAAFAADSRLGILAGRTVDADGVTSVSPHMPTGCPITRDNVFEAGNSNGLFVRREIAQAIGGFDETLGVGSQTPYQSGEETDFILRGLAAGASGRFDPSLLIHHDQSDPEAARRISRVRGYSAGFGRVLRKNGFGWRSVAVPAGLTLARATLCAARLDFAGAAQRVAWASGAVRGFSAHA